MPLTIGQNAIIDILYACCVANLGERGKWNHLVTKEAAYIGKSKWVLGFAHGEWRKRR